MIALYIRELDVKGGTHKQFYYLADYLKRNNVDFKIITHCYEPDKTFAVFKNLEDKIVCINRTLANNTFLKIYNYWKFIKQLRLELKGIRLLNIHDNGLQLLIPFLGDKKIIWQINDLPADFRVGVNQGQNSSLFNYLKKGYIKFASKLFVDRITVNVSKNAERVTNALGMPADVLYCGIEKLNITRKLGTTFERFSQKRINLLSSGVFMPYRNYETGIKVVKELLGKGYDVHLEIIGNTELDPIYTGKVQRTIEEEKLQDRIHILGQVSEEQFIDLHENSDIFLFLNIDQSWGLAVFEAMSCGIPVIVSQSVGATEILVNNQDAIFANPTDEVSIATSIEKLVNSPDLYRHYHNNGIRFSDKYSWDNSYSSKVLKYFKENDHGKADH